MVHLVERTHSARFVPVMDQHMPRWHAYRAELNSGPLAHEEWLHEAIGTTAAHG